MASLHRSFVAAINVIVYIILGPGKFIIISYKSSSSLIGYVCSVFELSKRIAPYQGRLTLFLTSCSLGACDMG